MKVLRVAGCPLEDNKGEILHLYVSLDKGEIVNLGQTIGIEMMDDSILETEVKLINPKKTGDFQSISKKVAVGVANGAYKPSKKLKLRAVGPCYADLVVLNVPYHEVKTDEEIGARKMAAEMQRRCCLTPFKELEFGEESIHDYVDENFTVPNKVIAYLQTTNPYIICPGFYEHPFIPGKQLLGPYTYSDGYYYWDRDTWKYVVKYNLTLPQEFINHVMSDEGTEFLRKFEEENPSWGKIFEEMNKRDHTVCLLPGNAGDESLEDF